MIDSKPTTKESPPRGSMSRGQFMTVAGIAAAVGVLPFGRDLAFAGILAPQRARNGQDLQTFQACLGQDFHIQHGLSPVTARLTKVTDLRSSVSGGRGAQSNAECFKLLFRSSDARALAQNTYQIEHKRLGSFPLFLVPMESDRRSRHYEAVIYRVAP